MSLPSIHDRVTCIDHSGNVDLTQGKAYRIEDFDDRKIVSKLKFLVRVINDKRSSQAYKPERFKEFME